MIKTLTLSDYVIILHAVCSSILQRVSFSQCSFISSEQVTPASKILIKIMTFYFINVL